MKSIIIHGRIVPSTRSISIPKIEKIQYSDPRNFAGVFDVYIENSIIKVICEESVQSYDFHNMAIGRALEIVTGLVDLYAFTKGWALHVSLETFQENGNIHYIGLSETSVQSLNKTIFDDDDFREVADFILNDFDLKFALRDLISSLSNLNYSSIAACRAVEAIRNSVVDGDVKTAEAWGVMRSYLQLDETYLKRITDLSKKPRHGDRGAITGQTQLEVTHKAWIIMNRFIEFKKRGGVKILPVAEFPVLE